MMITTDEAPLPNDAQLNWSRAFESLLWSTIRLLLVCFCSVDCLGLEPPPPMMKATGWVQTEENDSVEERSTGR